jgi:hypothetical protein
LEEVKGDGKDAEETVLDDNVTEDSDNVELLKMRQNLNPIYNGIYISWLPWEGLESTHLWTFWSV